MKELINPNAQSFGEGELDFKNSAYGPNLMKKIIMNFNQNNNKTLFHYLSIVLALLKQVVFLTSKLIHSEY